MKHSYADARPSATPRVDRPLALRDGRRLQIAEWGRADGRPVVYLHGRPGSRLFCPDEAATMRAGVRLISFDRAGYGRSTPRDEVPTFASSVADVVAMLDQLGVGQAALIGWSGGGPHALACAALAADRVSSATAICAPTAPEARSNQDPDVVALERAVLADHVASGDLVRSRAREVRDDRT